MTGADAGFSHEQGYKVFFSGPAGSVIAQSGSTQDPLENVALVKGWNWVGMPAFRSFEVNSGIEVVSGSWNVDDLMKTRSGSATALCKFDGDEFQGPLTAHVPGRGYEIFVKEPLVYKYVVTSAGASAVTSSVSAEVQPGPADVTGALIGGGIAAVALLAFLFLATRKLVQLRTSSAPKGLTVDNQAAAASAVSASAADDPVASKGVLLETTTARARMGLSWFKPAHVQLLAAPARDDSVPEAPAWSALVVDGVAVPYEEVARVRMDEGALEFIVEHGKDTLQLQHLRMFTRPEFNLWREALHPKITNSTLHMETKTESKPSAVLAAHKWLANAEPQL